MDLPTAAGAHEATELGLDAPPLLRRLLLERAERSQLTLTIEDVFDGLGPEGADQLVLEVVDAHVEAQRSISSRVRSAPRPACSRPRRNIPSSPASHNPASLTSSPRGPKRSRKLRMFVAPPIETTCTPSSSRSRCAARRERFDGALVAEPLDEHDRVGRVGHPPRLASRGPSPEAGLLRSPDAEAPGSRRTGVPAGDRGVGVADVPVVAAPRRARPPEPLRPAGARHGGRCRRRCGAAVRSWWGSTSGAEAQKALMYELAGFHDEIAALPRSATGDPHDFHFDNDRFSGLDAAVLYALVRHLKPRRFIEVGSGFSTLLTALALRRNEADGAPPSEFVAIEPYPLEFLDGLDGLTKLIVQPVQEVPLSLFDDLGEGDVLFIDSSHVLKIGSDVQYLFLEVLPRLRKGVIVHVHDIFLPWEYPQEWVMREERFWNEAYLLQAFLTDNRRVEVLLMNCWNFGIGGQGLLSLVGLRPDEVTAGSFWFRYVA